MTQTDRHRAILEALAAGTTTAEQFAERFDVSARTIYRDVAALHRAGAPIAGEPGLGYRLAPAARFAEFTLGLDLTEALVAAVNVALRSGAGDVVLLAELQRRALDGLGPVVQDFVTGRAKTGAGCRRG